MSNATVNTLDTKAILIRLAIGLPGNVRKDKELTSKVQAEHSLAASAGRWIKQVYPDTALAPLIKISGEARQFHYAQTLPWADEGSRILPCSNLFKYADGMRKLKSDFADAVTVFCAKYQDYVDWAKQAHNGTFRQDDYPGADIIRERFYFKTDQSPIPSGSDFRIEIQKEELKEMAASVNERVKEAVQIAKNDLGQRLAAPIKHLSHKLKEAGTKENFKLHDSLLTNIREIIDLIPALNVTGDAKLEKVRKEAESILLAEDMNVLRVSDKHRKEAAEKADAIAAKLAGYFQ